jgi:exopolyphosphatase/guanosine-5'-triphosphate,3'-diphosphate pyrophosphatase
LGALRTYGELIERLACDRVVAVATEAVRKAINSGDFVGGADAILGNFAAELQVIDGEREARLCWRAVTSSFPQLAGPRTVLDIGGGSTELIVGERDVEAVVSLPIGSVRLTERLITGDPPGADERARLAEAVDAALANAPAPRGTLVGIAGTVTTLSAMALALESYDGARVHGSTLSRATVDELVERLATTPLADKRRTPGLDPKRADVIYAGAVILARVMARAGAAECMVSDRGIRWGLIYEAMG